jgi:hypothetical protein
MNYHYLIIGGGMTAVSGGQAEIDRGARSF